MVVVSLAVSPNPPRAGSPVRGKAPPAWSSLRGSLLARYDLQIRYLPEDFIERFKEDRTTLLYFYQQVRGGPEGLLAPARSALQPPRPTPQLQEGVSSSPAQKNMIPKSPKTIYLQAGLLNTPSPCAPIPLLDLWIHPGQPLPTPSPRSCPCCIPVGDVGGHGPCEHPLPPSPASSPCGHPIRTSPVSIPANISSEHPLRAFPASIP